MTAIGAAIIELKAHCEHTWEIIRALERFAAVVEDAHEKAASAAPVTTALVACPEPATRTARPAKPQPAAKKVAAKPAPAKPNGKPAATGAYPVGAAIISALGAHRGPMSPKALVTATKLPRWRVMRTLLDMHASGQLAKVGTRRGATYALHNKPRSGAAAGTQAAPPVGPPSANGRQASPGGFDIAWSGTKERNGEAPSILPPRERKS